MYTAPSQSIKRQTLGQRKSLRVVAKFRCRMYLTLTSEFARGAEWQVIDRVRLDKRACIRQLQWNEYYNNTLRECGDGKDLDLSRYKGT